MNLSRSLFKSALWLILAILSASCMEFYVARIWSAGQPPHFSDLYAPWWASHELFLHRRNPYTPEVAHQIQTEIYGAAVDSENERYPGALAGGFAYPLYASFLMWPSIYLPFALLQHLFAGLAAALTLGSTLIWLRAFGFRGHAVEWLTLTFFAMGSFPVLQGMHLQNLSLIAAALLTLSITLLCFDHLSLAGFLLAASTFKPQFTILLVPWLALWIASDWRRRQSLAWSFLAAMLALIAASEFLLRNWVGDFLKVLHAYRHYTFGHSLLDIWFTPRAGPFAAAALILAVLGLAWKDRRLGTASSAFLIIISIMLAASLTVIPTLAPHTQLLLFPGLFCLYCNRDALWSDRRGRIVLFALCLLLAWPWLAAIALTSAAVLFPVSSLLRWWDVPLYTSPILPMAVLLTLCLLIRIRPQPHDPYPPL